MLQELGSKLNHIKKISNLFFRPYKLFCSISYIFFACLLSLNLPDLAYALTFSNAEIENFDSKLKIAAKNISKKVLSEDSKVLITVIDFLNLKTQVSEERGELLEEQFTELLYEMIPEQVVPYFEIVSLRLEWKERYKGLKREPLTENIAKLTNADWLVTGTYENNFVSKNVNIKLFDLISSKLIWETFIESERLKEKKAPINSNLDLSLINSDEKISEDYEFGFYPEKITFLEKGEVMQIPDGMVLIPEGEFIMGSDFGDEDELPDHLVLISSFFLDIFEVTNFEYSKCSICQRGTGKFDSQKPEKPVVYVDWSNADVFCKSKNKRLPTEAEWEYAARAGSIGEYSFGEDTRLIEKFAWFEKNTVSLGNWGAKDVGSKQPNQWGVFDMHGNVMEWVQNYYKSDYFASVRQNKNPTGPTSPVDENYPLKVVRGGAWGGLNYAGTLRGIRSSKRYAFVDWTRSFQIGFRCAMDIDK